MDEEKLPGAPEEEAYERDLLTLEDESGQEHDFEVLDATEVNGNRYLAMVPYSEDAAEALEQDAEMIIMRVGEEDGEEVLDIVDDDEELQMVVQVFLHRLEEVYDIDLSEYGLET